jgi:CTP synthase (UTP-ammonia lyase)
LRGEPGLGNSLNPSFYVATLFLPQISSSPERPHPLIVAYLRAALAFDASPRK